jgi:hypothetical protein
MAVVAAPVAEEFFFRRLPQGWLEKILPQADGTWAIGISAAAFALAHQGQGLAYVPLFPLGIVLGFLAHRTGSIVPCILLHALFNAGERDTRFGRALSHSRRRVAFTPGRQAGYRKRGLSPSPSMETGEHASADQTPLFSRESGAEVPLTGLSFAE